MHFGYNSSRGHSKLKCLSNVIVVIYFWNLSPFQQIYFGIWNVYVNLGRILYYTADIDLLTTCQWWYVFVSNVYVSLSTVIYCKVDIKNFTSYQGHCSREKGLSRSISWPVNPRKRIRYNYLNHRKSYHFEKLVLRVNLKKKIQKTIA